MTTLGADARPATEPPGRRREIGRAPSLFSTGRQLPEVRWAAAALLLFLIGWALRWASAPEALTWVAFLGCYAAGGWEPLLAGLRALRERTLDVDLLMIVAAVAAAAIGQVFDGGLLIVIFATSGALEAVVTQRTAASVAALLELAPETATLVTEGTERTVPTSTLVVGDIVLVRPGERIGADGVVLDGSSEVDQQAITGEAQPVPRTAGGQVLSGTVNGTGVLTIQVERPAQDSVVARIVTLVEQAAQTKAQRQLFVEKVERRYSLLVVAATVLVLVIPLLVTDGGFDTALLRAITFMIVASPCAVVLSTMPPLLAAMANAGRHGVLVKSATAMETLGGTDLVAFDKTGTLTEGTPVLDEVLPIGTGSADEVLVVAAAVERSSEHPLGRAVLAAAREAGLEPPAAQDFRAIPGVGVTALVDGRRVDVGRGDADPDRPGSTVVAVQVDGRPVGTLRLSDRIRPDAAPTVAALTATGIDVALLTGDNTSTAAVVARRTGIRHVHAGLLPQEKTALVRTFVAAGRTVMMVGDGVNDGPALAAAHTGVAMGRRGSDLALETADAITVRDDLATIPRLIRLSRRARRYVQVNLCLAATIVVGLVCWDLLGTLPLPLAVAGHEGSTVLVALNGLRLLHRRHWA